MAATKLKLRDDRELSTHVFEAVLRVASQHHGGALGLSASLYEHPEARFVKAPLKAKDDDFWNM